MGADGGIQITKISNIRKNWSKIKTTLTRSFENDLSRCSDYEFNFYTKLVEKSKELPDSIEGLTADEIKELLMRYESCDCPYLLGNTYLITAIGDYVEDQMNTLSYCLDGIRIETWT